MVRTRSQTRRQRRRSRARPAEEAREPVALKPRPVKRTRPRRREQDSRSSPRVPSAAMPQDLTASALIALAARKEEAREALEAAIREMGTNPAQVEAERAKRERAERQRDQLLVLLTHAHKGDVLVRVAHDGDNEAVAWLLGKGVDPNAVGSRALRDDGLEGTTPLAAAIRGGHDDVFEQLLGAGADCEKESGGFRPLMVAACVPRPACLRRLLAAGASVNVQDEFGFTVLHCVADSEEDDDPSSDDLCARLLLDGGADKNAQDANGRTPLMSAAENNYLGVVATLLKRGADKTLKDDEGMTALEITEAMGHEEMAELLRG